MGDYISQVHSQQNPNKSFGCRKQKANKAVYTTAPVAGGWAGAVTIWAGAAMIWAGAVMIWAGACSNTNFPTLKMPKNKKKQSLTNRPTDRPTNQHGDL